MKTSESPIAPEDFSAFFSALWGYAPFHWQDALLRHVLERNGQWPTSLNLPTASGKTAVLDIAIFHLAMEISKGCNGDRNAPMRIIFTVDRRLVVDDAHKRASIIAKKLAGATDGILKRVATHLQDFPQDKKNPMPLAVAKLRGGIPQENDWARTPCQPTIVVSTVDQIGSRLLFRGYGISESMRPIHAGLLGFDSLIFLDEAHLSYPFWETLSAIKKSSLRDDKGFLRTVFMSATLPPESIGAAPPPDLNSDLNSSFPVKDKRESLLNTDDILSKRLTARKHAILEEVPQKSFEGKLASRALKIASSSGTSSAGSVIAVVVNRVQRARKIFEELEKRKKTFPTIDTKLLIGRSRHLDRERLMMNILPRIRAKVDSPLENENSQQSPLILVATQCVEAGADLDFDYLITEVASLDALRQRFGRLNRLGKQEESKAWIYAIKEEIKPRKGKEDYIYGISLANTWKWLKEHATPSGKGKAKEFFLDMGVSALESLLEKESPDTLKNLCAPRKNAPFLFPAYIDAWSQTRPAPMPDPHPALFLHGKESAPADVQVVWREDLEEKDLESLEGDHIHIEEILQRLPSLKLLPPSSLEALSLPYWSLRTLLARSNNQKHDGDDNVCEDVEGSSQTRSQGPMGTFSNKRPVLRWRGRSSIETKVIRPSKISPGDTIVLPADYGGCDKYGFNPQSAESVLDYAFEANLRQRGYLALCFSEKALGEKALGQSDTWRRIKKIHDQLDETNPSLIIQDLLEIDELPVPWKPILSRWFTNPGKISYHLYKETDNKGSIENLRFVLSFPPCKDRNKRRILLSSALGEQMDDEQIEIEDVQEASTENDWSSFSGGDVSLEEHSNQVRELASAYAESVDSLRREIIRDIELAAYLHDIGKAERRFQAYLRGLDPDELTDHEIREALAKSARPRGDPRDHSLRRQSQLPRGARHECWSVSLAQRHPDLKKAHDPDLVLWLIGTHHGYGRPFFPPVNDELGSGEEISCFLKGEELKAPVQHNLTQLNSGWIERFQQLKEKYGPWRLAYMEAILRLADHRASEEASKD